MTDSAATSQPRRRRWLRWAAIAAMLIFIAGAATLALQESADLERARNVKLGQSFEDVQSILGHRNAVLYVSGGGQRGFVAGSSYRVLFFLAYLVEQATGHLPISTSYDNWPIHIHFDSNGRVDRIKRGSETIE